MLFPYILLAQPKCKNRCQRNTNQASAVACGSRRPKIDEAGEAMLRFNGALQCLLLPYLALLGFLRMVKRRRLFQPLEVGGGGRGQDG